MTTGANTFSKEERLCSSKLIDRLFSEGNRQISAFPVRLVWLLSDDVKGVQILINAPKRNFHHAVDRNRIKRQIREFYRTSSASLKETVSAQGKGLVLAFLFNDNKLWETDKLVPRLQAAMDKLVEAVSVRTPESGLEKSSER
jgi:ribonuclease P protein component